MSALAEALVAAQARAVSTIGKQYLAEKISYDEATDLLKTCGCGDEVELEYLLACWSAIRAAGAQAPPEQKPCSERREDKPATEAQIGGIKKRMQERHLQPLTDEQYVQDRTDYLNQLAGVGSDWYAGTVVDDA